MKFKRLIKPMIACIVFMFGLGKISSVQAQFQFPNDYEFILSYTEDKITSYKVNDIETLSDSDKYRVMGRLESADVKKYSDERFNVWTHKDYTHVKEGWWTKVDEILISPDKITTKTGKGYKDHALNKWQEEVVSNSTSSFLDLIQFPVLTQVHFDEFDKAGVPYFTSQDGELIVKLAHNVTLSIHEEKKYTKEVKYYNDEHQNPNSVTRTNYFVALAPEHYQDKNGTQMYTDENPIFIPGKIVIETYIQLPSGECAEKIETIYRSDIDLVSKNAESLAREYNKNVKAWTVSPNPVQNTFTFNSDMDIEKLHFNLFDIQGREFTFIQNGNVFNVSDIQAGIYFLRVYGVGKEQTIRFIKAK